MVAGAGPPARSRRRLTGDETVRGQPAATGLAVTCAVTHRTTRMAELYFYYSAMNAGKTTTLLQSAYNYHERGMRTLILTPRLDDRYGEGTVASRIGLKARGVVFGRDDDLESIARADIDANGPLHCMLVDESQF